MASRDHEDGIMSYVSLGGVASLGMGVWAYLLARSADGEARQLASARFLDRLEGEGEDGMKKVM